MADPKAIQFLEGLYSRVDKQVRDIVTSMLPGVTIAAQDDGTVIANDHRILNFQGPGVTVSDESAKRRVNVYVPGAPVAATTTTIVSATTAKAHSLWTGSANSAPPAGWETTSFSDTGWSAAVSASHGTLAPISGTSGLWSSASPVALSMLETPTPLSVSQSGTFGPATYSAITPTYYPDIPSGGGFTTYTFTGTCHDSSGGLMQLGFVCKDASGTMLNLGTPGTGGLSDGQTNTVTCGPSGSAFSGNFSTADHFSPYVSGYGDGFQTGSFDWTLTWDGTPPVIGVAGEQCLLRQTFALPAGTIATATLDMNAEAHVLGIYVNGNFVTGSITDPGSSTLHFTIPPANLVMGGSNLIAVNAQNYTSSPDYAWVAYKFTIGTSSAGTDTRYIPYAIADAKGDLIAGTGVDTAARLAVGTNGYVLTADSTQATGLSWAAAGGGGGGGLTKLAETILGSAQASVSFSSIASTYRNLRVTGHARGDTVAATVTVALNLNGDTAANYDQGMIYSSGGTANGSTSMAVAQPFMANISAASAPSGDGSAFEMIIPDYSRTTFWKSVVAKSTYSWGTGAAQLGTNQSGIVWRNTAAVSSIQLIATAGNFVTGSVFTLYAE